MQMTIAAPDASCSMCGGTLRPLGRTVSRTPSSLPTAAEAAAANEEVQRQAEQILMSILPTDLLGDLAGGGSKPADDEILASLPLHKIEPYISLRVTRGQAGSDAASAPRRALLAEAAGLKPVGRARLLTRARNTLVLELDEPQEGGARALRSAFGGRGAFCHARGWRELLRGERALQGPLLPVFPTGESARRGSPHSPHSQ